MGTATALDDLVAQALGGSRDALEALVRAVQDDVYGLALRMLWHPQDAADATQEILIKIITHLGSFRGESAFRTWCYRVASNHLLTIRASRAERKSVSFEALGEEFAITGEGASPELREPQAFASPDHELLAREVKLGCTLGMLQCLDRPHRLTYIVSEILDVSGDEGAELTDTPPATYRKRLSRARARIRAFMQQRCGLVNEEAACRCEKQLGPAIEKGRVDPDHLLFAGHPERLIDARSLLPKLRELEELHATARIYRSHPDYAAPASVALALRELLRVRTPSVLSD